MTLAELEDPQKLGLASLDDMCNLCGHQWGGIEFQQVWWVSPSTAHAIIYLLLQPAFDAFLRREGELKRQVVTRTIDQKYRIIEASCIQRIAGPNEAVHWMHECNKALYTPRV